MTTAPNRKYKVKINVYPEWAPGLGPAAVQAYYCSPHWYPVATDTGILYVWWDFDNIEAAFPIQFSPWNYALIFRSRKKKNIYVVPVSKIQIPGGRHSNLTKKFRIAYNTSSLEAAIASVLTGSLEKALYLLNICRIYFTTDSNYIIIELNNLEKEEEVKQLLLVPFEEVEEE